MIEKYNEPLSKYTTFRMGGNAIKMYFPESVDELTSLVKNNGDILKYVIGGGSNLLINDLREYDVVLCLKNFNSKIENLGDGRYYIGASVPLKKIIRTTSDAGYGGIEYLYSVPGLLGGAICMNAGRGKKYKQCISDYLLSVDVLENGEIRTLKKSDCEFNYRSSRFQNDSYSIIIGGLFEFSKISNEISAQKINERIELCKKRQDMSLPNFGTVFCESNKCIMKIIKYFHLGYKGGCTFSNKTTNWMLNGNNGTFEQALNLLNKVIKLHEMLGQTCKPEVKIWK